MNGEMYQITMYKKFNNLLISKILFSIFVFIHQNFVPAPPYAKFGLFAGVFGCGAFPYREFCALLIGSATPCGAYC
jgi:hypothetical protein